MAEESTVIVLDNAETLLPPAQGSPAANAFDPDVLDTVLFLFGALADVGCTRLIWTTRESLPPPFNENSIEIGRLTRQDAVALVGSVLAAQQVRFLPEEPDV